MNTRDHNSSNCVLGAVLLWLCYGAAAFAKLNHQLDPPPVGAGIIATLQTDQDVYTNQAPSVWCPPCVTNTPRCLLPCYLIEGKTAMAQFAFTVENQYHLPRTFQFSSGQQFDLEIIDQTGRVVAAWSDDKFFTQALTSFTLEPGEAR